MRIAIYPGSFDPITLAHQNIYQQARQVFDEVYLVIAKNGEKSGRFNAKQRLDMARAVIDEKHVIVVDPPTCVTDWAAMLGAKHVVRGIRDAVDVLPEQTYKRFVDGVSLGTLDVVYFMPPTDLQPVSSSAVRQILALKNEVALYPWLDPRVIKLALG